MSITLDALVLPEDLHWVDEFDWDPVVQGLSRFESGVLQVEESQLIAGREITLEGDEGAAWGTRELVKQLALTQAGANATPMTLTIHGAAYQVIWRRPKPMTAQPIRAGISNPEDSEPYSLSLRFITV